MTKAVSRGPARILTKPQHLRRHKRQPPTEVGLQLELDTELCCLEFSLWPLFIIHESPVDRIRDAIGLRYNLLIRDESPELGNTIVPTSDKARLLLLYLHVAKQRYTS